MSQHLRFRPQDQYPPLSLRDNPPPSPDPLGMPSLGGPAGAGVNPLGRFTSLSAYGTGICEAIEDSHPAARHRDSQSYMPSVLDSMMHRFMDEEPWNALSLAYAGRGYAHPGRKQPGGIPLSQDFPNFTSFRSAAPPSETDTFSPSAIDSGYGSLARQSVGNPSVYGGDVDHTVETQSLISRFREMGGSNASSEETQRHSEGRGHKSASSSRPARASLTCPDCNAQVRTNSELKKHQARHNRPYKCDVPGCAKAAEGFSTNNDLERHKKCVHKLRKPDETVYRCYLGPCKDKPKDWPRQDNFRQHLKRKHRMVDVDVAQFRCRPSRSAGLASPGTTEAILPETARTVGSDPSSPVSWAGLDQGHAAPVMLVNGALRDPRLVFAADMAQFSGEPPSMEGRDFASLTGVGRGQCQDQNGADSVPLQLEMDPVLSSTEPSPRADQASCIDPDMLRRGAARQLSAASGANYGREAQPSRLPENFQICSQEVIQLEADETPGSYQEDGRTEQEEVESVMPDDMSVDEPDQDVASELQDSDADGGDLRGNLTDEQRKPSSDFNADNFRTNEIRTKPSQTERVLGTDTSRPVDLDDETRASAIIQSLMTKGLLDKILIKVGYQKSEETETKDQKLPASSSVPSENNRIITCNDCNKPFRRPCELKKHQKRHEKPYACTFAKCDRRFGSKNDWKRHESSQHFQLEIWRCAEKTANGPDNEKECGKVCHRRESLKSHLERDHDIRDESDLEKKLAECRMGRNFESRFWCGFCQKTIEPTGTGGPAHSERFDHIDDHFMGRGGMPRADIKDWKHVEPDTFDPPVRPGKGRYARSGDGQPTGSRKRLHGSAEDASPSRSKRSKGSSGRRDIFWNCCLCGNYWSMDITSKCMDSCNHSLCDGCDVFENWSTESTEKSGHDQLMT
ncbi:hypothetical protein VTK56DRAFT_1906 [Thermocarpiscus australiensis]